MLQYKDLSGKRFDKQVVVCECPPRRGKTGRLIHYWYCQCDCGQTIVTSGRSLESGHTRSCGCQLTEDLVGKRFGKLTVIKQMPRKAQPNGQKPTRWKCKCDCGHYTVVTTGNQKSGHTISCGCQKYSKNEWAIEKELRKQKINHAREYMFSDLLSEKGNPLRFDFAFFDKDTKLIGQLEYQGQQHFETHPGFESFGRQQREVTDPQKKEYCTSHNIPLYEITYKDDVVKKLNEILHTLYGNLVPSSEDDSEKV